MSNPLDNVRGAREALEAAKVALRDAVVSAVGSGERAVDVADAAGFTRQRVYQLVSEAGATEERMSARLAELDERWERWIDRLAPRVDDRRYVAGYAAVTRFQNAANGKSVKRGRGKVYRDVRPLIRDLAESELLEVLEHRGDELVIEALGEGFDVQAVRLELDEAATLREKLSAFGDTGGFFDGV